MPYEPVLPDPRTIRQENDCACTIGAYTIRTKGGSNPVDTSIYTPPRLVFWETTAGCNLECIHCRRITLADQLLPQDLTTEEAFALIDQIVEFARPIFVLSGGEPLFRPDIFEIARHASDAGLIVALATNGTLIDADVAKQIKESGVRRVSVSFDGADAQTHDIFRGPGAFDKSIAGMHYLAEAGVPIPDQHHGGPSQCPPDA